VSHGLLHGGFGCRWLTRRRSGNRLKASFAREAISGKGFLQNRFCRDAQKAAVRDHAKKASTLGRLSFCRAALADVGGLDPLYRARFVELADSGRAPRGRFSDLVETKVMEVTPQVAQAGRLAQTAVSHRDWRESFGHSLVTISRMIGCRRASADVEGRALSFQSGAKR